jgi:serine/threonine protein kinase
VNAGPVAPKEVQKSESEDREERELLESLKRATIGEYDIYSQLGRGGMATVFLALELSLNRAVAIKVISPSALSSTTIIDRFWLEARTAASLSHPHVIPIYAVRAVGGLHFFVMKHVQGGSLDVVLRNEGPFSFALTRTILSEVGGALAYAHRRGVIHRDIKPANIMLDDEGFAVVMDFGIAKVRDAAALTASGAMVGTPFYMSPEQFSGDQVDGRSDQYSLGVVAFELLTGKRPYKGETVAQVLRGHLLDRAPDVREFRPDCPTALATALNRMLSKQAGDRYPSMEALCTHLESMPRINADKIREQIISLARTASSSSPQISEPLSPLPQSRTSTEIPANAPAPSAFSSGIKNAGKLIKRRPIISGAVALLAVAITSTLISASGSSATSRRLSSTIASQTNGLDRNVKVPATSLPPTAPARIGVDSTAELRSAAVVVAHSDSTSPARNPLTEPLPSNNSPSNGTSGLKTSFRDTPRAPKSAPKPRQVDVEDVSKKAAELPLAILPFAPETSKPVEPPPLPQSAFRIGSRNSAAFLYIDGVFSGIVNQLRAHPHPAGRVHLQIRAEDCMSWDTAFSLSAGDSALIGYRNPSCTK